MIRQLCMKVTDFYRDPIAYDPTLIKSIDRAADAVVCPLTADFAAKNISVRTCPDAT